MPQADAVKEIRRRGWAGPLLGRSERASNWGENDQLSSMKFDEADAFPVQNNLSLTSRLDARKKVDSTELAREVRGEVCGFAPKTAFCRRRISECRGKTKWRRA
jgi:hypothetical protein